MAEQSPLSEVTVSLHGTIETFPLTDVLALLASTRKTGELRVDGARGEGRLWFDEGRLVGQRVGPARDFVDAVFELLRLTAGSFDFDADKGAPEPTTPADIDPIVAEALARLEEWHGIETVIPSLQHGIRLASEAPAVAITLRDDQWRLIVAVAGGRSVEAIIEHMALGEFETCKYLCELVVAGLAVVDAPVAPARPAPKPAAAAAAPKPAPPPAPAPEPEPEPEPVPSPRADTFEPAAAPAATEPVLEPPAPPRPRVARTEEALPPPQPPKPAMPAAGGLANQLRAVQGDDSPSLPQPRPTPRPAAAAPPPAPPAPAPKPAAERQTPAPAPRPAAASLPQEQPKPRARPAAEPLKQPDPVAKLSPADAAADSAAPEAPKGAEGGDEAINRGLLLKFLSSVRS